MNKKNKRILLVLLVIIVIPLSIILIPLSPLPISKLYITGNDVIKNYNLETFDGNNIVDGAVPELENKLKFEPSAFWKTTEDDLEIIDTREVGNRVSIEFFVTMRNKVNIYTNVRLPNAVEKDFIPVTEDFQVGTYRHLALDGQTRVAWDSYLHWTHYDFGNVLDYNLKNNLFSGPLKMSFDINPNPIPVNFSDNDGNLVTKQFDYISINAMWVSDKTYGKLSTDLPEFVGLTPAEYDLDERNDYIGGTAGGSLIADTGDDDEDYSHLWDPDPRLSDPFYPGIDPGIQPATIGSTLSPKTKDGVDIWDPVTNQESMTDCEFTYNLGALSPLVYEYFSTLSYVKETIVIQDKWVGWLVLGSYVVTDTPEAQSHTRQVGLHVTNRYIQTEFSVKFKLFTSFEIAIPETEEQELEEPEEYYDELLWQMIVDGFGGGQTYTEGQDFSGFMDIFIIIIVIVVVIAGIYIFMKIGMPLLMFKLGQKSRK